MTPYKLALWIFKFVIYLTLLFSVPVVVFYGGVISFALIKDWRSKQVAKAEQEKAAEQAKADAVAQAAKVRAAIPAKDVCDLAILNNGYSIKHRWRLQASPGVTRLGLGLVASAVPSAGQPSVKDAGYVDINTAYITGFEKDSAGCN